MSDGDDNHKTMLGISPFRAEDDAEDDNEHHATHPKSVEERLAAQRKAMALKTRPMKALTELDWDLPGATDGPGTVPPAPVAVERPAPAPPVAEAESTAEPPDSGPVERRAPGTPELSEPPVGAAAVDDDGPSTALTAMPQLDEAPARSGTIRMSAAEIAGITGDAADTHDSNDSDDSDDGDEPSARGGTMLMSAAAIEAAVQGTDTIVAAPMGGPTADEPTAGPTADVAAAGEPADADAVGSAHDTDEPSLDDDAAPAHSAGGTMLMSAGVVASMIDAAGGPDGADAEHRSDDTEADEEPAAGGTMLMSADAVASMAEGADRGHHAASGTTLTDARVELPERHVARRPDDTTPPPQEVVHADASETDPFTERRNYRTGPTTLQPALDASVPLPSRPDAAGNELERVADAIRPAAHEEDAADVASGSKAWMWVAVLVVVLAIVAFVAWSMLGS